MKNSNKKIVIILAIIVVILIALVGTGVAMVVTGQVAITSTQKLTKGISDIQSKISLTELEDSLKEKAAQYEKPFENETTITANINEIQLEDMNGMEDIIEEIKNTVNNTQITNTLKADLKNNILVDDLKLNMGEMLEELSAEVQYTGDELSLRSKELNARYMTLIREEAETSSQYEALAEIFDLIDELCNPSNTSSLYLTQEEKNYIKDNYGGILSESITDDMINEEKTTILLDGTNAKSCSKVSFTLNRDQIVELIGKYLTKLESDETGKQIIIKRMNLLGTFDETDLQDLIDDIRYDILDLSSVASVKFSTYSTMFKTYGFDIEFIDEVNNKISVVFGESKDEINATTDNENILNITKTNQETIISSENDETSLVINIKKVDNEDIISINIKDLTSETEANVILTKKQLTKTETNDVSDTTIEFLIESMENVIDFEIDINSNKKYVNAIDTSEINNSNSLDLINATSTEIQEYINEITNNGRIIMESVTQKSKLLNTLFSLYGNNSIDIGEGTDNTTADEFNTTLFSNYTGTIDGQTAKSLLSKISVSNASSMHKVAVSITDNGIVLFPSTSDVTQFSNADSFINTTDNYTILVNQVDEQGYISAIEIRKQ